MPTLVITREDLLRGKVLTPGWYKLTIKSVDEKAAGGDGSMNTNVSLVVSQPGEFEGVPLKRVFNEKAPGFAIPFIQALSGERISEEGGTFDLSNAVGREVYGYVKTRMWQERPQNDVADFLPVGGDGNPAKLK